MKHSFIECLTALGCCGLLLLTLATTTVHGFGTVRQKTTAKSTTTQLSMAWTLPNNPSNNPKSFFRPPTWYQDCGNPTARQVVYHDDDNYEYATMISSS